MRGRGGKLGIRALKLKTIQGPTNLVININGASISDLVNKLRRRFTFLAKANHELSDAPVTDSHQLMQLV